jgi:hypothetical protein
MTDTDTTTCVCGGCGVVPVDSDYVARQAAKRTDPDTGEVPVGLLAALADSVRPCHECRPDQYEAWRDGRHGPQRGGPTGARRGARRAYRGRRGGGE